VYVLQQAPLVCRALHASDIPKLSCERECCNQLRICLHAHFQVASVHGHLAAAFAGIHCCTAIVQVLQSADQIIQSKGLPAPSVDHGVFCKHWQGRECLFELLHGTCRYSFSHVYGQVPHGG
jgi:hypothetical protein